MKFENLVRHNIEYIIFCVINGEAKVLRENDSNIFFLHMDGSVIRIRNSIEQSKDSLSAFVPFIRVPLLDKSGNKLFDCDYIKFETLDGVSKFGVIQYSDRTVVTKEDDKEVFYDLETIKNISRIENYFMKEFLDQKNNTQDAEVVKP